MAFSLSPSVQITERDMSLSIPNLPSAKTGMVLRADTGPCNKIMPITSEAELLTWFGKPTAYNYKDWFNAWNFLQYAASLYVVRPTFVDVANNESVKNAGVALTGESAADNASQDFLFNTDVAEQTLQDSIGSGRLNFYNRNVTSNQNLGLAVCSNSAYWKTPIANEFFAIVSRDATSLATINDIGGLELATGYIATGSESTMVAGSKFIGNGNKMFTVTTVYNDKIKVSQPVTPSDISADYGTLTAGTVTTNGAVGSTISVTFDTTFNFNINIDSVFVLDNILWQVSAISSNTATLTKIIAGTGSGSFSLPTTSPIHSNSVYNHLKLSTDYSDTTTFRVAAGTKTLKVENGFNFPVNSQIKFVFDGATSTYTNNVTDSFAPEESGNTNYTYEVIDIDTLNNLVTLDRGLDFPIAMAVAGTGGVIDDIVTIVTGLRGVNLYSNIYDDSVIRKTTQTVYDTEKSKNVNINVESLIKFNALFDYEPNWVAEEFVTVVLKKNTAGKFEIVEKKLASYDPNARDIQNRNLYVNEIFYYGSSYLYCKESGDATQNKVNTSELALVKFTNDYGSAWTEGADLGYWEIDTWGTVYPLKESASVPNTYFLDPNENFVYDPNNYSKADIQNAQQLFADAETFDVNILLAHELDLNGASTIAESRKDCVAIVTPYNTSKYVGKSASSITSAILDGFGTQTTPTNPDDKEFSTFGTYSAIYGNMKYQYDKFNDLNRWVSLAGDIAGLYALTDSNRDAWYAVAGLERGKVRNAIKLAYTPNKQLRDELYVNSINIVESITGEGNAIVMGQKTATAKPSALDRLNVRRLMIVIEKAVATAVKYALFEFNDSFTRTRLVGMIDPFLRTVKARRGVYEYAIQCDTNNNNASVVDANGLVIDVYIKPTKVAEFIQINFNILRSDANITELIK